MNSTIKEWVIICIAYLASALLCYLTYTVLLFDLTKINISFLNWLGILVISALIIPKSKNHESSSKGTKVSRDIFKDGF